MGVNYSIMTKLHNFFGPGKKSYLPEIGDYFLPGLQNYHCELRRNQTWLWAHWFAWRTSGDRGYGVALQIVCGIVPRISRMDGANKKAVEYQDFQKVFSSGTFLFEIFL